MRSERFFQDDRLPFAEVRYSRGSTAPFKPHLHRTLSIGAVDQGKVLYRVGDQEAVLIPGAVAVINPDTLHFCNPLHDQARSYYMLFLKVDWCRQVQQSLWQVNSLVKVERILLEDMALYDQYCTTMEALLDDRTLLQEKEQLLYDLVCRVMELACGNKTPTAEVDGNIEQLKHLLETDLHKDLPLNVLAEEFAANPYTLLRRFKTVTGITPHAYRMNCRIEQAKHYLREGRDIADTALDCGFFDQSHFHRHFKAMTTVTPQQYRVNFVQ